MEILIASAPMEIHSLTSGSPIITGGLAIYSTSETGLKYLISYDADQLGTSSCTGLFPTGE